MPAKQSKGNVKKSRPAPARRRATIASRSDRHDLYQRAVQDVKAEIDFIDKWFKRITGRLPARLREDFCGTGNTSCEFARRRPGNSAVGFDIDQPTLDWGVQNNLPKVPESAQKRVKLVNCNVLTPVAAGRRADVVLACNFSYWIFKERELMVRYFREVHRSLVKDGVMFLDACGGWETFKAHRESRPERGFTYTWQQASFNPITHECQCYIHFKFKDGSAMPRAFSYNWRIYSLPEIREMLLEAGFRHVTIYWEGDDGQGGGNGIFLPATTGEDCPSFIVWISAEK